MLCQSSISGKEGENKQEALIHVWRNTVSGEMSLSKPSGRVMPLESGSRRREAGRGRRKEGRADMNCAQHESSPVC